MVALLCHPWGDGAEAGGFWELTGQPTYLKW